MPKLAFSVNTDLLRRFTVPQAAKDLRLANADAAWSGKSNIMRAMRLFLYMKKNYLTLQGKSGLLTISANGNSYDLRLSDGRLIDILWKNRSDEKDGWRISEPFHKLDPMIRNRSMSLYSVGFPHI